MLSYWPLNETAGTPPYVDIQGPSDGTACPGNHCPLPGTGLISGGQIFDGSTTGIDVPANATFDWGSSESFSIAFWMKGMSGQTCHASGSANNEVMIGRDDSNSQLRWWLGCRNSTGKSYFQLRDVSGNGVQLYGPAINNGAWHYIVGVRDHVGNVTRLYVDGVEVAAETKLYTTGFAASSTPINIGWLNLDGGFHFQGTLDEIALFDRALTATEIQQYYEGGLAGQIYTTLGSGN